MTVVLASASPRREALLRLLGVTPQVYPAHVDEGKFQRFPPREMVKEVARAKVQMVWEAMGVLTSEGCQRAQRLDRLRPGARYPVPSNLPVAQVTAILGADTVVVLGRKVLGKPSSACEAARMLALLSGKEHRVYTGLALAFPEKNRIWQDVVSTKVKFRLLTPHEIQWYVGTGEPFDKAGGYGIQEKGGVLVEAISGDYFNVVGLPLSRTLLLFRKAGLELLSKE